ncbi:MAG: Uma2 family endonuclease [Isosphaeraceae bacterium]
MSQGTLTETPPATSPQRKRWTIAEFDGLVRDGYLREGSRAYLWDGEILEPMSENQPHANAVENLTDLLKGRFHPASWTVNQAHPIVLREGYKPQPDLAVIRGPRSLYRQNVPTASDVVLLVEVSDSSRAKDLGVFLRAYAEAGIPRYWVVDIPGRRVDSYASPTIGPDGEPGYAECQVYGIDAAVPLAFEGEVLEPVPVAAVLQDSIEPEAGSGQNNVESKQ